MDFTKTKIEDVILISPKVFGDERGFVFETFREDLFAEKGINTKFVQENISGSRKGVLRGLHYQIQHAQGKLIRAIAGEIFDVAVDIRKSSQTFGQWVGLTLSANNKYQLWVPPGFAHGFLVTSEWAEVSYKITDYYAPEFERSIVWNDEDLKVEWPLKEGQIPLVSFRDSQGKHFKEAEYFD